jgi:3D-(3,5/4)-trihydroxycyclohexane-1,2-dione acylhydrolase (decyclizing)
MLIIGAIVARKRPEESMGRLRLSTAEALIRYLAAQQNEAGERLFAGVWAIFGHGNVGGLGNALHAHREALPTFRAHNEQAMAHAAIGFAKAQRRRRIMACTSSIGPGATNMVTAAALAHVNRLPVLFLPGDVFASRRPDPVLQQIEDFTDATVSANDCFRPVSRWWDRVTRPEQLLEALPRALAILTDPASCGPATLCLPQDVQAETAEWPEEFFESRTWRIRRPPPDAAELVEAAAAFRAARAPLVVAGGGVHYAEACAVLGAFAEAHGLPVAETQAGKGALAWDHPRNVGAIGVTGAAAANALGEEADLVLAVGTRLQDFTTGSRRLFKGQVLQLNVAPHDAAKHGALPLVADAQAGLAALGAALAGWRAPAAWTARARALTAEWHETVARATAPGNASLPSDAEVVGAVNRAAGLGDVVVGAAGGLPGELHKLWRAAGPGTYHLEYGYSCMGYEIAGALGVKLADPSREVFAMLGDGAYLMLNSEIATSIALGLKLVIVVLDNRGFGCIERLQRSLGGASFNNRLAGPAIDFTAHAASLGAAAEKVGGIAALPAALGRARAADRTAVVVIETDPDRATLAGGFPWEVPT